MTTHSHTLYKSSQVTYAIWQLMRMDKPYGVMLLYWPCAWTILLTQQNTSFPGISLFIFFIGALIMRACGCVINDIADRDIDGHVERTKNRPIAAGILSITTAIVVFCILSISALSLWIFLQEQTRLLSIIGFVLACMYPFAKRYIACPQVVLGVAFAWGVPMACTEQQGAIDIRCALLYVAVVVWIIGYDTVYALQDREDDKKLNIGSSALFFGSKVRDVVAVLYTGFLFLMAIVGRLYKCSSMYYIAWVIVGGILCMQVISIQIASKQAYKQAFLSNQWIGLLITLAILLDRFM
ncbi:MAG: 4-hydroxybenzoate octaprenyltransferase [Pseudomonadota bacterium]|nr:4-hydroxybenzoate octaprenyltransferase [Pseudomonadota bacterium]